MNLRALAEELTGLPQLGVGQPLEWLQSEAWPVPDQAKQNATSAPLSSAQPPHPQLSGQDTADTPDHKATDAASAHAECLQRTALHSLRPCEALHSSKPCERGRQEPEQAMPGTPSGGSGSPDKGALTGGCSSSGSSSCEQWYQRCCGSALVGLLGECEGTNAGADVRRFEGMNGREDNGASVGIGHVAGPASEFAFSNGGCGKSLEGLQEPDEATPHGAARKPDLATCGGTCGEAHGETHGSEDGWPNSAGPTTEDVACSGPGRDGQESPNEAAPDRGGVRGQPSEPDEGGKPQEAPGSGMRPNQATLDHGVDGPALLGPGAGSGKGGFSSLSLQDIKLPSSSSGGDVAKACGPLLEPALSGWAFSGSFLVYLGGRRRGTGIGSCSCGHES